MRSAAARYETGSRATLIFLLLLVLSSVAVRAAFLDFVTFDVADFVLHWYARIAQDGAAALGVSIPNIRGEIGGNYTPPYYYLLFFASLFDGAVPPIYLVKLVSLAFELVAAFFAYRIVSLKHSSVALRFGAAGSVIAAPTVIANGAVWGQCDVIYASFLLAALDFVLRRRYGVAAVMLGVGFAFKAPAIFFAPFLLMLVLQREAPWRVLAYPLLAYVGMMTPAIALGRDPAEVLTTYFSQGAFFEQLSMNAPNLYHFIPNTYYQPVVVAGVLLTGLAAMTLALLPRLGTRVSTLEGHVLAATTFAAVLPFLLPKMHDRYFFAADLMSIILAFYVPRLWMVPVLFQLTSITAYAPILALGNDPNASEDLSLTGYAALVNAATVAFLVILYMRMCLRPAAGVDGPVRHFAVVVASLFAAIAIWVTGHWLFQSRADIFCGSDGLLSVVCGREQPLDLRLAGPKGRAAFAMLVVGGYVVARLLAVRLGFLSVKVGQQARRIAEHPADGGGRT